MPNTPESVATSELRGGGGSSVSTSPYNENGLKKKRVTELTESKLEIDHSNDTKPYVTETYQNGTSWYRVWSDGWIEQGGYAKWLSTVTFLKPFSNTSYTVTGSNDYWNSNIDPTGYINRSKTSMYLQNYSNANSSYWQACGY